MLVKYLIKNKVYSYIQKAKQMHVNIYETIKV